MADALRTYSTRRTPQTQPAGGATVKNAAGGYAFGISDEQRLRRFLVMGSEGTYYAKAPELTRENADVVVRMARANPISLVDTIVEISVAGRAPRQNPAIFALAIAASESDETGRRYALAALPKVCRTATHLYLFAGYVEQFRGWGRTLKRAVGQWYNAKDVDKLSYQILKYRQREGWRHADLLALSHPAPTEAGRDNLYRYIVDTMTNRDDQTVGRISGRREKYRHWNDRALPDLVVAYREVQAYDPPEAVELISQFDLSWEMLPDRLLCEPTIWEALLDKGMPQTALIRQLPRLTRLGLCDGATGTKIAAQLQDAELLKRGRVHPINMLVAQRTYASGHSVRGESTWTPSRRITDALDAGFYAAYGAVEPSGKRILLACDVSGSMSSPASGLPISCREAVAALSLVTLNVEQDCEIIGFSDGTRGGAGSYAYVNNPAVVELDVTPRRRLDDVCKYMAGLRFGRTDLALPYLWAQRRGVDFDAVVTLTDNETFWGKIHPWQALKAYREHVGHDVKVIVVAMTATGVSVADPNDGSSLDVAGMDASTPQVLSDFAAGKI